MSRLERRIEPFGPEAFGKDSASNDDILYLFDVNPGDLFLAD